MKVARKIIYHKFPILKIKRNVSNKTFKDQFINRIVIYSN